MSKNKKVNRRIYCDIIESLKSVERKHSDLRNRHCSDLYQNANFNDFHRHRDIFFVLMDIRELIESIQRGKTTIQYQQIIKAIKKYRIEGVESEYDLKELERIKTYLLSAFKLKKMIGFDMTI